MEKPLKNLAMVSFCRTGYLDWACSGNFYPVLFFCKEVIIYPRKGGKYLWKTTFLGKIKTSMRLSGILSRILEEFRCRLLLWQNSYQKMWNILPKFQNWWTRYLVNTNYETIKYRWYSFRFCDRWCKIIPIITQYGPIITKVSLFFFWE